MLNIVITVAVAQITNAGHSAHNEIIDGYVFHDLIHLDTFFQPYSKNCPFNLGIRREIKLA